MGYMNYLLKNRLVTLLKFLPITSDMNCRHDRGYKVFMFSVSLSQYVYNLFDEGTRVNIMNHGFPI